MGGDSAPRVGVGFDFRACVRPEQVAGKDIFGDDVSERRPPAARTALISWHFSALLKLCPFKAASLCGVVAIKALGLWAVDRTRVRRMRP